MRDYSHVVEKEGPFVRGLVQDHGGWFARAMSCFHIDSDQNRGWAGLFALQLRDKFVGMGRNNAIVMIGSGHHGRRVGNFAPNIVNR